MGGKRQAAPKITPGIIGESGYELVKAPDYAGSRAWHVLAGGKRAGLVRPTWRGERSRRSWEAAGNAGTAAVSLLRTLLRNQENGRRRRRQPCPA